MTYRSLVLLASLALVACSDHDDSAESHGTHGSAGSTSTNSGALTAPVLKDLMPMAGGLHVQWSNTTAICESIDIERKSGAEDFKVVFSVPGEADNKHDAGATGTTSYTYRLRCKKGADFSPYSNEMSKSPM